MFVIALQNQVHIYSVDTSAFYYDGKEKDIANKLNRLYLKRNEIKKIPKEERNELQKWKYKKLNKFISVGKKILKRTFKENMGGVRDLDENHLADKNVVSVFESSLTRGANFDIGEVTTDIIIVRAFYFDILNDLVVKGFTIGEEKYKLFTASAGQIRTKKSVFIKESLWSELENTLTCGLSIEKINEKGGINVNKYLAYLALTNSATDKWGEFDIDKCIVVKDFETTFKTYVDYIDEKTYEIKEGVLQDVTIPHMDGCGMCLPKVNRKPFMIRMPWVKGLIVPFQYNSFVKQNIEENPDCSKILDIYGKEWDILKDDIQIIFTESQFKMYKYYESWKEYKDSFKKYNCEAGICNEEPDRIKNAKINYQMIQTLVDATDEELISISEKLNNDIKNISTDRGTMLKVMGVTEFNENKNYLQKCLEIYPELLQDEHCRQILRDTRKKLVKEGKSARLPVNGKYTFLIPDLYAFSEWLFLGEENPKGILNDGEVYCKLYQDECELDVLRSPHLFFEHAVRKNTRSKDSNKWFITKGIYTSVHDPISRILQFDVDGDKALVVNEEEIIKIAKRNAEKYNIHPLYYDMAKADPQIITNEVFYNGMINAYSGGNIGAISNDITKIWNSEGDSEEEMKEKLEVIKYLCMENNFVIDYAKTLYKPKRPKSINELIKSYTKSKTPRFFMYAKDKGEHQVEALNECTVNRLDGIVKDSKFNFRKTSLGKFDYKLMMNNSKSDIDNSVIERYEEHKKKIMKTNFDIAELEHGDKGYIWKVCKEGVVGDDDLNKVVDTMVKYLFEHKERKRSKMVFWECFGEEVYSNLSRNIENHLGKRYIMCEVCGKRIEKRNNKTIYCEKCATVKKNEQMAEIMRSRRNSVIK